MSCDVPAKAQSFNVSVYLVKPKSTADDDEFMHGNVDVKTTRKRNVDANEFPLLKIYIDSHKLRQCSKYFDTCMSARWMSSPQTEFYLDVHTDIRFYKDCFDHIRTFPCLEPISSVTNCIQVLKVASQIEFSHLLESGVRYLAAVPWSHEDENQIRALIDSGHLSGHSTTDLHQRLQFNAKDCLELTRRVLLRSLKLSATGGTTKSREQNRSGFQVAFKAIVRSSGGRQMAVTLIKEELEILRISIQKLCLEEASFRNVGLMHLHLSQFAWLYLRLREAGSAEEAVQALLADQEVSPLLQSKFQSLARELSKDLDEYIRRAESGWAGMLRTIFQDILDGRLFLTTEDRRALFRQWIWILKRENFEPREDIASLVSKFVMAFPLDEQEAIFDEWLTSVDEQRATCDLSEAHSSWLKHLISKVVMLA